MPTIDTTQIPGYETMTPEQRLDAVLKLEIPEAVDLSKFVAKGTFDSKASEAAEWKRKHDALLSDEERKKQESETELANIRTELATLRKEKQVSDLTAKYIALGYDKSLASETATAYVDGDMDKVFANGEKYRAALEKSIKEGLMKDDPRPGGSGGKDNPDEDAAVAKGKAIAKSRFGNKKTYEDTLSYYKK